MIAPEQLVQALDRINPRDRELLSLSLRRRVPDEALGRLYECEPAEIARRRARGLEGLANELDLQRSEDLGALLEALLEPETWSAAESASKEQIGGGGKPSLGAVPLPCREREAPDPPRRAVALALFGLGIAALLGVAGIVGATQLGGSERLVRSQANDNSDDGTRHFVPREGGPLAVPFPSEPGTVSCYSTAVVRRATTLYSEPGGRRRLKVTARTEWGSPRVLGVVNRSGRWLGVQAPELRNGEIAWVRREQARLDCVSWSLHADLSKRTVFVRRDGHRVRKLRVAVGRQENPTPRGRFTVTDKLRVTGAISPYGCCVLALTGHQTNLPPYWPGGDRLALHATNDESSIGNPVSLGCLRVGSRQARWLINTIPLGAPIFIRA